MVFFVNQKEKLSFVERQSIDESSFGYSLLAPYKNSDHFDARTTNPVMRKNVTTWVHLFGLTNKATWRKSLTSGAKINRRTCLQIRSLPVSVLKGTRKYERVNMQKVVVAVFLYQFPAVPSLPLLNLTTRKTSATWSDSSTGRRQIERQIVSIIWIFFRIKVVPISVRLCQTMAMPVVFVRKSRGAETPIIKEGDEHNKILLPLHVKLFTWFLLLRHSN